MKKLLLLLSSVAFVFGFSSASSAQCTVQSGDSIWHIAERYKIPFHKMLELNRHLHNPHLIFPKDKIEMPNNAEHGTGTSTNENSKSDDIQHGNEQPAESEVTSQAEAVLKLVNAERAKQGLQPLTLSTKLTNIATLKSKDMADNNYFDHTSKTYGTPFQMLQDFGVHYSAAGENIAAGQRTPEEVMNAWLNSSGHRANILNKNFDTIGIGYYQGGTYGVYWTQLFTGGQ
jgi:uncharacterized YkwD family protein